MSHSTQQNAVITTLTLGRNTHQITEQDRFLNNGICTQLIKATPMKVRFGEQDTLTLSKKDIEHLQGFTQQSLTNHEYHANHVFSLVSKSSFY